MMMNNKNHRQSVLVLCEACEIVPAAFLCKADSASLCAACDEDVHSANPLASRHHRVPIISATAHQGHFMARKAEDNHDRELAVDDDEAASWLLLNPVIKSNNIDRKGLFGAEVEDYLNLDDYDSSHVSNHIDINLQLQNDNNQSVVVPQKSFDRAVSIERRLGLEYDSSNNNGYNKAYPDSAASSQSNPFWWNRKEAAAEESSSATEFSTISHSTRHPKGTIDLFLSAPTQVPAPHQLSPMERKARVLRYREKKKTRKFEKTIRYASRKAYAETRPRIKGRFAKRRDDEVADQQIVLPASNLLFEKYSYGVVPSISLRP